MTAFCPARQTTAPIGNRVIWVEALCAITFQQMIAPGVFIAVFDAFLRGSSTLRLRRYPLTLGDLPDKSRPVGLLQCQRGLGIV